MSVSVAGILAMTRTIGCRGRGLDVAHAFHDSGERAHRVRTAPAWPLRPLSDRRGGRSPPGPAASSACRRARRAASSAATGSCASPRGGELALRRRQSRRGRRRRRAWPPTSRRGRRRPAPRRACPAARCAHRAGAAAPYGRRRARGRGARAGGRCGRSSRVGRRAASGSSASAPRRSRGARAPRRSASGGSSPSRHRRRRRSAARAWSNSPGTASAACGDEPMVSPRAYAPRLPRVAAHARRRRESAGRCVSDPRRGCAPPVSSARPRRRGPPPRGAARDGIASLVLGVEARRELGDERGRVADLARRASQRALRRRHLSGRRHVRCIHVGVLGARVRDLGDGRGACGADAGRDDGSRRGRCRRVRSRDTPRTRPPRARAARSAGPGAGRPVRRRRRARPTDPPRGRARRPRRREHEGRPPGRARSIGRRPRTRTAPARRIAQITAIARAATPKTTSAGTTQRQDAGDDLTHRHPDQQQSRSSSTVSTAACAPADSCGQLKPQRDEDHRHAVFRAALDVVVPVARPAPGGSCRRRPLRAGAAPRRRCRPWRRACARRRSLRRSP